MTEPQERPAGAKSAGFLLGIRSGAGLAWRAFGSAPCPLRPPGREKCRRSGRTRRRVSMSGSSHPCPNTRFRLSGAFANGWRISGTAPPTAKKAGLRLEWPALHPASCNAPLRPAHSLPVRSGGSWTRPRHVADAASPGGKSNCGSLPAVNAIPRLSCRSGRVDGPECSPLPGSIASRVATALPRPTSSSCRPPSFARPNSMAGQMVLVLGTPQQALQQARADESPPPCLAPGWPFFARQSIIT